MLNQAHTCIVGSLNHIGIAVTDLEQALLLYQTLFDSPSAEIIEPDFIPIRAAVIKQGDTHIELLEPLDSKSEIGKFISKRGEGLHHVAFDVSNLDAKIKQLKSLGISMIDEKARMGITGQIAFIHPSSTRGTLIELVETLHVDKE